MLFCWCFFFVCACMCVVVSFYCSIPIWWHLSLSALFFLLLSIPFLCCRTWKLFELFFLFSFLNQSIFPFCSIHQMIWLPWCVSNTFKFILSDVNYFSSFSYLQHINDAESGDGAAIHIKHSSKTRYLWVWNENGRW